MAFQKEEPTVVDRGLFSFSLLFLFYGIERSEFADLKIFISFGMCSL